jgi:aminoglycoside phosphotransferase (APT) family kinase protein
MNIQEIVQKQIAPTLRLSANDLTLTPRPALESQSNNLYDLRAGDLHFIVKEYLKASELESAPLHEYRALQLLSPLDVAPQPVFFDPTVGPVIVYEFMPGEMWDRQPPADLNKMIEIWLRIQDLPVDWPSHGSNRPLSEVEDGIRQEVNAYHDWAARAYPPGERAAEICLKLLNKHHSAFEECALLPVTPCFCRSDPRFANVIQRPDGRLGLVDWEDCGQRDPAREVADLLTHPNQEDLLCWEDWQRAIDPYCLAHSQRDSGFAHRFHLYLAIFPLWWLSIILHRGLSLGEKLPGWSVNGLPVNERLRHYLARALAWPETDYEKVLRQFETLHFFPD